MLKRILLASVITLLASGAAMAGGFYVGAGVGANSFNSNLNFNDTGNVTYGHLGAQGSLYAGYVVPFSNQFGVGIEAFGNIMDTKTTDSTYNPALRLKERNTYGLRLLPGYRIAPTADMHLIAGFVRGGFRQDGNNIASKNFNANGFQVGLGGGVDVSKNVGIRGDVAYNHFQNKTITIGTDSSAYRLSSVDAAASLAYMFG